MDTEHTTGRASSVFTVGGLVARPTAIDAASLRMRQRRYPDGAVAVAIVDVLSLARLSAGADVLVVADAAARVFAIPVRDVIDGRSARLIPTPVGSAQSTPRVRLDVPGWTSSDEPVFVRSIRAMTFEEFLGWR